jgi:hypothetical protein
MIVTRWENPADIREEDTHAKNNLGAPITKKNPRKENY